MARGRVKGLNPALLIWARERAGQDVGAVAASLKKDVSVIEAWESGVAAPTYVQLEKLAYEVYKRPIAIFFFPFPPEEPDAGESFRTLPEFELERLEADTLFKVRKARALQESLAELNNARNPALRRIFDDIKLSASDTVKSVAANIREYLGVELGEQKTWKSPVEAFKSWRSAIENSGVFVFKDSFKQSGVSGFCLVDREFPIIYVNNSTPPARQVFTLLHELAHILLNSNGLTNVDDSFIALLKGAERQIEVFCNAFAAEFLVPDEDFRAVSRGVQVEDDALADLARLYSVSREVILRRFLEMGTIGSSTYESTVSRWRKEYESRRAERVPGGNYYATQATYLGKRYLELAFGRFYRGECTMEQLAGYLNVKATSVSGLEDFALS